MATIDDVIELALTLSKEDMQVVVDVLEQHLLPNSGFATPELEKFWMKEIERRIDDLDAGRTQTIPGEQVLEEIRQRLHAKS